MPSHAPSGGLTFTGEALQDALNNGDNATIRAALALLDTPTSDPLNDAYLSALRYQCFDSNESAQRAIELLRESSPTAQSVDRKSLLGWLSVVAMLRGHPAGKPQLAEAVGRLTAAIESLDDASDALDHLWQGALQLAAGIVIEEESRVDAGAEIYRGAIDWIVHPEGYLKGIADVDSSPASYRAQVSGACALAVMAEMGTQAGLDLWAYNNRGVTPATASTYLLYYFYFPEKWKWAAGLTREVATAAISRDGAFIELVNLRSPLQAVEPLLDEVRPLFSPWAGGLTTLTHSLAPDRPTRRWRLW